MKRSYELSDLEQWDERIREKVEGFGLTCFPQEFEICDHSAMMGYMAYSGMPSHYPHWSYGKAHEKLKTLYNYGVSGLPYEMVINSNPALAYLMRDNSLLLQILTIAHVYGHNDFFKNNFTFRTTRPEHIIATFKAHAMRVRRYVEDPSIGIDKVEAILDAAHALSLQCRRNLAIRKQSADELKETALAIAHPPKDPFQFIHRRKDYVEPDLDKTPLEPDEDILLFIRDHNPFLMGWQKDLLTIVHEEAQYFIPQIETKIMNEGWASYWHKKILDSLDLPQDLQIEFIVRHNQVIRPHEGGLNPYHIGFKIWENIQKRWDETPAIEREEKLAQPKMSGREMLFQVREVDRDVSFIRRFLTEKLMAELDFFEYQSKGEDIVVHAVSNKDGWKKVKETFIASIGTNAIPTIKVHDADFQGSRSLLLAHNHDGRDLELTFAEKTLNHAHVLWGKDVVLRTIIGGKKVLLRCDEKGFRTTGDN